MALTRKVTLELFAQTAAAQAKLDAIRAEAEKLSTLNPEIRPKIESAAVLRQMAVLREELKSAGTQAGVLSGKTETLSGKIDRLGKSLDNALPRFAGLATAGIALGPAILPVLAAATAGAVGLGAAMAGAGAALGIFGLAARGNLTELQKQLLKVQAANKAAAVAEATVASKRTAAQKQAIASARELTAAFQKEFGAEANAIEKLKSSWLSFTTQPVVTNAIAAGARLLADALPHLLPLLRLGALAVNVFTSSLSGFVNAGGLDRLVRGLVNVGRPAIIGFVAILHNLAVAFGALAGPASSFASGAVGGLVRLSQAFANWATNKGPAAFSGLMDTIRRVGPAVVTLIRSLAAAVPNLVAGISPLAPVSLALATALAKLIRNVPPGVITAIAVAFAAWTAAAKGLMAAGALGGAATAIGTFGGAAKDATIGTKLAAGATKAWAIATDVLALAMRALPWVAIVTAIVVLAAVIIKYHKQIWAFVQKVWDDILKVIQVAWDWVKKNWPLLLGIMTGPIGLAAVFIVKHFTLIKDFIRWAWDQIQIFSLRAVKGVLDAFSHIPLIGHIFRKAADAVGRELGRIQKDSARTWDKIQAGMDSLHGKKVALTFSLDLPPGVTYPSRHIKGRGARGIAGAAAGTWLVGEEGPELAYLPQGTRVLPAGPTRRIMGGLAGGTLDSFSASFPPTRGLTGAFQAAIGDIAREIRALIGVIKVHVPVPGGGGGAGVQRWAGLVAQVLAMLGQPGWTQPIAMRQMQTESGGNPTVVNKWDSNWLAGHPSVGLMQVIAGTFASYAGRFRGTGPFEYGVSVDPMANIYAGLNYAVHRYGAAWTRVLGQGHGYDLGGFLPPGLSLAYNGTGRPEPVGPARGGNTYHITVNVPPGGNMAEAGRQMVTAIREHERRSGKGWRK